MTSKHGGIREIMEESGDLTSETGEKAWNHGEIPRNMGIRGILKNLWENLSQEWQSGRKGHSVPFMHFPHFVDSNAKSLEEMSAAVRKVTESAGFLQNPPLYALSCPNPREIQHSIGQSREYAQKCIFMHFCHSGNSSADSLEGKTAAG